MTRPVALADEDDFVRRYQAGVSLKQLSKELGVSRAALQRILRLRGVPIRNRSDGMRARWMRERATGDWRDRIMRRAWEASDARNTETERKVVSMYRAGLGSQSAIARRLGLAKPTVGGILRKNGIVCDKRLERRAVGIVGGFCRQTQTAVEADFAEGLGRRGIEYIHQGAVGTRNLDFLLPACRIAVEIVRRHRGDAKSLRRERVEQVLRAGWRLWIVYDPMKRGIDVARCCDHLVACAQFIGAHPSAPGQYWVVGGDGKPIAGDCFDLHDLARIAEPKAQ